MALASHQRSLSNIFQSKIFPSNLMGKVCCCFGGFIYVYFLVAILSALSVIQPRDMNSQSGSLDVKC
uniref:Putative ovule protein n=1 Tax=Solanum chacoense TaxID=4108 RepID=A0A0V0I0X4_SOLCH